ncbi:MAG: Do family serine endopeptidase [Deltaproteobacteria bacterium]|jgi:serine protease Do|nr:Do family serine endopeptidase [Deltaproteobacteria bacterium]
MQNNSLVHKKLGFQSYPLKLFALLGGLLILLVTAVPAWSESNPFMDPLIEASKARAELVQSVQKSVVHIKVEQKLVNVVGPFQNQPRQEGSGSGAIVRSDGYILTNHHVVGEADKISVQLYDGQELKARLIGTDPATDISVIKIEGKNMPVLPMGNSNNILVGESVIVIGNPFGLSHTVTFGIISAKGRTGMGIAEYEDFIQTDAAINPGNSGGPLVDLEGKIVGVNTAIFSNSGGYQGIGFAVPINMARRVMNELIETGQVSRGWLGVGIQNMTPELAKAFGLDKSRGSLVTGVMPGTPAEKAGLQKGDVILRLNGESIENSSVLRNAVADARADATVELELVRNKVVMMLSVQLDERPQQVGEAGTNSDNRNSTPELGFVVQELTPETAQRLGYQKAESGVVITTVKPESPAFNKGLRAGMMIVEMNRKSISSMADFQREVQASSKEEGLLLLVKTPQGSQYLFL